MKVYKIRTALADYYLQEFDVDGTTVYRLLARAVGKDIYKNRGFDWICYLFDGTESWFFTDINYIVKKGKYIDKIVCTVSELRDHVSSLIVEDYICIVNDFVSGDRKMNIEEVH